MKGWSIWSKHVLNSELIPSTSQSFGSLTISLSFIRQAPDVLFQNVVKWATSEIAKLFLPWPRFEPWASWLTDQQANHWMMAPPRIVYHVLCESRVIHSNDAKSHHPYPKTTHWLYLWIYIYIYILSKKSSKLLVYLLRQMA